MENLTCSWSPKLIVELIKIISWPVVVILIGLGFRIRIFEVARSFFSKNAVSEISATLSGVSAKFITAKQSTEVLENSSPNPVSLPKNMSIESIKERHEQDKTEFSEELYQGIMEHVSSLHVDNEEKVELLARETSIFQSALRYLQINKVLFRSQYDFFHTMSVNNGFIRKENAIGFFNVIRNNNLEAFVNWELIKYISYPVSSGLIYDDDNGYKLTTLGKSYVAFMSNKPQFIDELAKL